MNSYNHYAYGAVCQWLFEAVAGFRPDPKQPGFKHIIFEPTIIPALSPVAASHDSAAGRIEAGWSVDGDQRDLRRRGARWRAAARCVLAAGYTRHRRRRRAGSRAAGDGKARSLLAPGRTR